MLAKDGNKSTDESPPMKRTARRPSSHVVTMDRGKGRNLPGRPPQPAHADKIKPALTPLAELTSAICPGVLNAVFGEHRPLVPAVSSALLGRGKITNKDRAWILPKHRRPFTMVGLDRAAPFASDRRATAIGVAAGFLGIERDGSSLGRESGAAAGRALQRR